MASEVLYLDHNATTPVLPEVREAMMPYLTGDWFNPSSPYRPAQKARRAVDRAREDVSALLACKPEEVTFTSCATESCNIAVLGTALHAGCGAHLITVSTEHHAVLNAAKAAQAFGCEVTVLAVNRAGRISASGAPSAGVSDAGRIDLDLLRESFRPNTALVAVMSANNETGILQDVASIGRMCRDRGILFHCDATAAIGKLPVHPREMPCDFLSLSGHKFGAPKGIGALFVREGVKAYPVLYGGEQEEGLRPGTENVAGIAGLGVAAQLAGKFVESGGPARIENMRGRIESELGRRLPSVEFLSVSGSAPLPRLCNTLSIRVPGVRNDEMVVCLDREGICVSTGAACSTGASLPSHVIRAMGYTDDEAREVVRVSMGHENTEADVDRFVDAFVRAAMRLADGAYLRARARVS